MIARSSLEREVRRLNLGPVKLDALLPTARHAATFIQKKLCCLGAAMSQRWVPLICYTLRRNSGV